MGFPYRSFGLATPASRDFWRPAYPWPFQFCSKISADPFQDGANYSNFVPIGVRRRLSSGCTDAERGATRGYGSGDTTSRGRSAMEIIRRILLGQHRTASLRGSSPAPQYQHRIVAGERSPQ